MGVYCVGFRGSLFMVATTSPYHRRPQHRWFWRFKADMLLSVKLFHCFSFSFLDSSSFFFRVDTRCKVVMDSVVVGVNNTAFFVLYGPFSVVPCPVSSLFVPICSRS